MFFKEKKKYRAVCFDWDGTAVVNRNSDVSELVKICDELLRKNFVLYVVTGTNVANIQNQFANLLKTKENLYISANRGSEVYGYKWDSELVNYYSITTTPVQNELLDKVCNFVKDEVEMNSEADIEVIFNRVNRRKINLNPTWENPPKEQIDELIVSTENYLKSYDYQYGISGVYNLLKDCAEKIGLGNAKITTDGKFLELGITDKSDSMEWVCNNLFNPMKIKPEEVLIVGDEFGKIGGIDGSDYKMCIPLLRKAKCISVGIEPNGVPRGVELKRGNVNSFLNILSDLTLN